MIIDVYAVLSTIGPNRWLVAMVRDDRIPLAWIALDITGGISLDPEEAATATASADHAGMWIAEAFVWTAPPQGWPASAHKRM